jgi:hypothetical protein
VISKEQQSLEVIVVNEKVQEFLERNFDSEEVVQIGAFLDRGFCEVGRAVLVSIVLHAKTAGKSVADILRAFETVWIDKWRYQHPDMRGDPTINSNKLALHNIFESLGMKLPEPTTPIKPSKK